MNSPYGTPRKRAKGRSFARKNVTGMQPFRMARNMRVVSWVAPGGHTQKMELAMSASVSCTLCAFTLAGKIHAAKFQTHVPAPLHISRLQHSNIPPCPPNIPPISRGVVAAGCAHVDTYECSSQFMTPETLPELPCSQSESAPLVGPAFGRKPKANLERPDQYIPRCSWAPAGSPPAVAHSSTQ